jgi:HK97 family phage major capsid protein
MTNLITLGSAVKMSEPEGNKRRVEGYLVLFGSPDEADFVGDYFTKNTDFDLDDGKGKATMYFNHGFDPVIKDHKLNHGIKAELTVEDKGVWIQGLLDEADEYDRMVIQLIESRQAQGKSIGWSSGSAPHLVKSVEVKPGIQEITKWTLGSDASLTHTPADYRNKATYKTIEMLPITEVVNASDSEDLDDAEAKAKALNGITITGDNFNGVSTKGTTEMNEQEQNAVPPVDNELNQVVDNKAQQLMANPNNDLRAEVKGLSDSIGQILQYMQDEPAIRKSGYYTEDGGTADPSVKSFGDFLLAVVRKDEQRLKSVYGSSFKAQTGDSGTAGGYLIPETFSTQLMQIVRRNSDIVNGVTHQRVPTRSGWMPSLDLTTAPTAGDGESAFGSGVGTNSRAEGGAYTEETANFDRVLYNVSDFASGYVKASREMMQEAAGLEQLLRSLIALQQTEKIEKGILRGTGSSQPLGILNASSASISITVRLTQITYLLIPIWAR